MEKKRGFLGFLASLFIVFFTANAYAAGYTCDSLKKYTSCSAGYYMTKDGTYNGTPQVGNACTACASGCTCAGGTKAPVCGTTCSAGKYWDGSACATCPNGYYCPGFSNVQKPATNYGRNACPTANSTTAAASSAYPDSLYPYTSTTGSVDKTTEPTRDEIVIQPWGTGWTTINACMANYSFSNVGGSVQADDVKYNSSTGKYDNFSNADIFYHKAKAGYYLYTKYSDTYCDTDSNRMFYRKVVACPAGSYCPGGSTPQCSTGTYNNEWGRNTCLMGNYCPAKSSAPTNCAAGTYRSATGGTAPSSCTACAIGSYSSAGATGCTACSGGKTTTATGQSSCNATCTNATGASTWTAASWSANSVTNKCAINACATGYTRGGTASSTGISSYTCSANCNAVTLNAKKNGGSEEDTTVYKRTGSTKWYSDNLCSTSILSITKPSKYHATYTGHYDTISNSGGTRCVTATGALSTSADCNVTGSTTFYARYNCNTGYTASGTTAAICTANCIAITLNNTQNGGSGGTTTLYKRVGSTTIYSDSSCSTALTLTKPTKTNATYAGHYTNSDSGGTQCLSSSGTWNSDYNPTLATTCYARYDCKTGYTASGTTIAGTCTGDCIFIGLDNTTNGGTGGTTALYKRVGSRTIYSDGSCSTELTLDKPTKTNATYAGHFTSGGTQCLSSSGAWSYDYNPTSSPLCYARYDCKTGYTASGTTIAGTCKATTNTITLNKNDGTGTCGGQSGTTDGSTTCTTGSTKTLPTWDSSTCNITNGNKIFMGWSVSSVATGGTTSKTCPTEDRTYYAAWATPTCSATNGTGEITTSENNAPRCTISCNTGYSQYGGTNRTTSFTVTGTAGETSVSGTCTATCNAVTLDAETNGGSENTTVYKLTGSTTWYSDSACSTTITTLSPLPTKTNAKYLGHYDTSSDSGRLQCVTPGGALSTSTSCNVTGPTTFYARYNCNTGYTASGTTIASICAPKCIAITLDNTKNGDTEGGTTILYKRVGSTTIYSDSSCSTELTLDKPTKTNATYAGHYTNSDSGGTQCLSSSGTWNSDYNPTSATICYARYDCKTGYTASGTTIAGTCTANCIAITLNNTQNGGTDDTLTLYKRVGSTPIYSDSSCSTALTLTNPTKTNATYAGHYDTDSNSGGTQCLATSRTWYSGYNPTSATTCYARYNCNTGYTASGTTIAGTCTANKYNVTYSCTPGTGTVAGDTATYNLSYSPKSSSCTAPSKHQFVGWTISGTSDVVTPGASFTWKYLENKTFTAKYEATSCDSGQYLSGGTCVSCPSGYTDSDLNATSNTQCYKACSQNCVSPSCPENSTECTFDTTAKWTGKQYYNSSTCQINDGQESNCSIATLNCDMNYYTNGSVCSACSSLGDGGYDMSLPSNNSSPNGCYGICSIPCDRQQCPEHATCTHGTELSSGGKYYPSTDCTAFGISCSINITCDSGYALDASSATCNPIVTPVVLDRNYNSTDSTTLATIYQKYETGWYSNPEATTTLSKATVPTRTNYSFLGYYTARAGGTQVIKADGTLPANTTYKTATSVTLYAQWSLNNTDCQVGKYYNGSSHVTCPAGKYCLGEGSTPIGTAGCAIDCPADAAGGTVTSDAGSSVATACRTVRTNQTLSDNSGRGDQTCYYNTQNANYSTGCTIKITACNAGFYREQENSTTCSSTDIGEYSPADALEKYLCKNLSGAATDVTTAAKNSGAATLCYNPCGNVAITNGTRVPVNEKEFYDGAKIPACTYTTNCNTGYQASGTTCVAKVLTITLNHNNGTANSTIYLKYADGWYSNSNASASSKITTVTVPSKGDGMAFGGYVSTNNDVVVGSDGKLITNYTVFSANATITAQYGNRTAIHCDAGKYYEGGSKTTCTTCPAGSYCPGVDTFIGVDSPRGINTCASLGGTYTHADGAAVTTVSSAAGATGPTGCYATNVSYTSSTNKATGSQTCYFNESTTSYTDNCKDKVVLSCVGGYWRVNASDTDCVAVGIGYYSAPNAITRTACPNLSTTTGVKTFTETSETVTQCYLGNIWYQGQHSGHRRSCYHTADASDTNVSSGYSYNCDVSVIVTCDAGYYDDGNYTFTNSKGERERDCVAVTDKNSYSPAQSFFTSEEAQPNQETPGSSTKLHSCPETKSIANGTARRVFNATWTASDYAVCEYKAATCDDGYRAITSGTIAKCVWDDPDACPEGFYCPDGGEEPIECPKDKNGRDGTTEVGAKSIDQCFIEYDPYSAFQNGTGSAICNYSSDLKDYTRCHDITAKSCNAGYYYRDAGSATCVEVVSGNYSPAGNIQQISCPSGGNGSNQFAANWDACYKNCEITVAHSSTVAAKDNTVFGISANGYAACSFHVTCQPGYSPNNNDTATPTCDANRYTVTLDKNGGDGNVAASIECTFDSGACALPATTGLTRAGYSVGAKWCTAKDGTGTCYNGGTTVTTNISANGTATTLYAIWTPNVYQITLKHTDATVAGAPATAYLKYATGWFADNSATLPLSQMSKTPEKTGYEFAGYKAANSTVIVDTNGMFQTTQAALTFTTAPADVTVVWNAGNTKCAAGTYYQGTGATCLPCTDNHYCLGGSFATDECPAGQNCDTPKSCADLGDGEWKYSDAGATGPKSCYRKCESYALDGGTAVPVNERAYYANQCEYKGVDEEGNPCDIEDGTCVTTSCKPSYEMIGGKCVACNRDHALSYKTTGNCMVESCEAGWHPYGQSCETDITECSAPNALRAEKQWDYKKNSYGICLIKECEDGFHISSNACVADVQECVVEHGTGEKEWNHTTNTWGECVATSCDPGFTNDPYETNEPTKQCGHCKNKFGVKGELAASSYSRGCTISACMYQGEMYNLENNECKPICDVNGYEDETGTMKWNPVTHKCERKCKEGYVMW